MEGLADGTTVTLNPGNYKVSEDIPATPIQLKLYNSLAQIAVAAYIQVKARLVM